VTDNKGGSAWGAAILGGVTGAAVMLIVLLLAARSGYGDRFVREAMSRNPEILVETADRLREKQFAPVLRAQRAALETPFGSSWQGAAQPDVTLVEFYDYACGYCKAALPVLDRLVKEDPGLRIVYREFPILGSNSEAAARLALVASKAGRFSQFHDALFAAGRPSPETLARAAAAAGIPADIPSNPQTDAELRRNYQLAGELGASGTPLFVVGDRVLNGAVGYDVLKKAIADARLARQG
jgi:thiol-disulfide isomerase/thioredoxin